MPYDDPKDIAEQVAARVEAEKGFLPPPKVPPNSESPLKITDDFILECLRANRVGDATLYSAMFRDRFVYVKKRGVWLNWSGQHWMEDLPNLSEAAVEEVCRCYLDFAARKQKEADKEEDKELKRKLQSIIEMANRRVDTLRLPPGRKGLLDLAHKIEYPLMIIGDEIDQKPYLLACKNGVIDLRTGKLESGNPGDCLMSACPTSWDEALAQEENPCPKTESFLLSSMDGDQEMVNFLWRLLGYGLIRDRRDHIFVIFLGEHGRNGKDTLIKVVTDIMGPDLSGDVPVEMLLSMQYARSSSAPSPDVLDLRGLCFAWINEAEENQRFALGKLKKLTGGGYITARGIQDRHSVTWLQTHLPIMTTNELPKAKADDAAFWHRVILIKWPLSFVDEPEHPYERKADKDLKKKLELEKEGVLVRMVRGALEYLRDGLEVPEKVKGWIKGQRSHWDDIGRFISEWCQVEVEQANPKNYKLSIKATDLHEAFCIWYARNIDKRFSISAKKFGELLNKRNIPSKVSNGVRRLGICLNKEAWEELDNFREKKG